MASELFRGFQRFSEIFQRSLEVFRGLSKALSEPLSECHFPLRAAGRVAPTLTTHTPLIKGVKLHPLN